MPKNLVLELAARNHWQRRGAIAPGGMVIDIALGTPGRIWLATDAGVWQGDVGCWRSLGLSFPLRATALLWANGLLIAGSASGGILYSGDDGRSWYTAWVDQTASVVTCFAASPSVSSGQVLLAGTDGAGILRSTDGGRRWYLANVGLSDFTVLALATAPVWETREVAFAVGEDAVYRSPNGGRAWKPSNRGIEGVQVQTLVVSPAFAADGTVYAGTEQHGIYRSVDGGDSWQPLAAAASFGMINNLWCDLIHSDTLPTLFASMGDGTLMRSTDRGESWGVVVEGSPALALAGNADRIYAGLGDRGLLFSDDTGLSWQLDDQLAARDITRLAACENHSLLAFGSSGGLWRSDGACNWYSVGDLEGLGTLFALICSHQAGWFIATDAGLFRSIDAGLSWRPCLEPINNRISVIAANPTWPTELWVGANDGTIWHSDDGGDQWGRLAAMPTGQPLVALAVSEESRGGCVLVAASFDPLDQRVTIWRATDAGVHWEPWLADNSTWPRVTICLGHNIDDHAYISIGSRLWKWNSAQWQSFEVDGTPVTALLHIPGTTTCVAATAEGVYVSADGRTLEAIEGAPGGFIDIAMTSEGGNGSTIFGLEPGGIVWEWSLRSVVTTA